VQLSRIIVNHDDTTTKTTVKREEEDSAQVKAAEESSSWVGRQLDALFSPMLSFLGMVYISTGLTFQQEKGFQSLCFLVVIMAAAVVCLS
jgi:hypothetical protein